MTMDVLPARMFTESNVKYVPFLAAIDAIAMMFASNVNLASMSRMDFAYLVLLVALHALIVLFAPAVH